ncbi:hypothetical protein Acsp07_58480 [Actinomycetospora sp. NBRC 106378]|nr:hypothetical protein Acsp07_58480 [Actinomycetospora sp. NBRC 106378]
MHCAVLAPHSEFWTSYRPPATGVDPNFSQTFFSARAGAPAVVAAFVAAVVAAVVVGPEVAGVEVAEAEVAGAELVGVLLDGSSADGVSVWVGVPVGLTGVRVLVGDSDPGASVVTAAGTGWADAAEAPCGRPVRTASATSASPPPSVRTASARRLARRSWRGVTTVHAPARRAAPERRCRPTCRRESSGVSLAVDDRPFIRAVLPVGPFSAQKRTFGAVQCARRRQPFGRTRGAFTPTRVTLRRRSAWR